MFQVDVNQTLFVIALQSNIWSIFQSVIFTRQAVVVFGTYFRVHGFKIDFTLRTSLLIGKQPNQCTSEWSLINDIFLPKLRLDID